MSLTSLIVSHIIEDVVGSHANGLVASGSITQDDARALVNAVKLAADIEMRGLSVHAQSTADALKALDARLKVLEHK